MKLLLANPNATESVTKACADLARAVASPGTEIMAWTNRGGPPVVDSFYGDYMAGRPLAVALAAVTPVPDAVVLAGFGNYGTSAVKEILDVPVVGLAEAAMAYATPLCHRFAIVTTSPRMIPYTQDLVTFLGFDAHCAGVRAVSMPPPDPSQPGQERVLDQLAEEVGRVTETGAADLVILGGALLSPYAGALRARTPVPVIEPVACAVQMAEAVVRLELRQSKLRKFAPPPQRLAEYG